jgi:hypothetical protein
MAGEGRKTFVAGEVLLAQELNDYLMDQSVMNFATEAARGSAIPTPTEGMLALTLDNDEIDYYNGSAWVPALPIGAWRSDTTTVTATTNPTFSTNTRRYSQVGKLVTVNFNLVFATAGTGTYTFDLPVAASASQMAGPTGTVAIRDASASTTTITYFRITSSTAARVFSGSGTADMTATSPVAIASGDIIFGTFTYEAA